MMNYKKFAETLLSFTREEREAARKMLLVLDQQPNAANTKEEAVSEWAQTIKLYCQMPRAMMRERVAYIEATCER